MKNREAIIITVALLIALLFIGSASAAEYRGGLSERTADFAAQYQKPAPKPAYQRAMVKKPLAHKPMVRGTLVKDRTFARRRESLERRIADLKKATAERQTKLRELRKELRGLRPGRMAPRN